MEACYGCGALAPATRQHAVIGILNRADLDPEYLDAVDNPNAGSAFVGVPVCRACHEDPAHRSARPLKVHFAERDHPQHLVALILAGSTNLQT